MSARVALGLNSMSPGLKVALGIVICGCAAALIVSSPGLSAVAVIGVWSLAGLFLLPPDLSVAFPMFALLLIPADQLAGLNEGRQGFFALGAAALLAVTSLVRGARGLGLAKDWDLCFLAFILIGTTLAHAGYGEVRGILFWVGAVLFQFWLRHEERRGLIVARQLATGILFAGALSGVLASVEYLTGSDLGGVVPGYQPHTLNFSSTMGLRASALSGHPLRLGTLTMLSAVIGWGLLTDARLSRRHRVVLQVALVASLMGLLLSGARGAWISLALSGGVMFLSGLRKDVAGRVGRGFVIVGAVFAVAWVSGLWGIIHERLLGSASHPGSINQRLQALEGLPVFWTHLPWFGLGFGGTTDIALRSGLKVPNLENEYLRFLLTAGVLGPLALLAFGIRRFAAAFRQAPSSLRTAALGAVVGLSINAATYNVFSWSIGPGLLVAVGILCLPLERTFTASRT